MAATCRLLLAASADSVPSFHHRASLQLDIRNYFMSIDKARLFAMLDAKLKDADARWLTRKLVFHDCTRHPVLKG